MSETRDPLRGTGRTTAGILRTIAHALENPGKWVPFTDHSGCRSPKRDCHIIDIVNRLKLQMSVRCHYLDGVSVKSTVDETC